MHTTAITLGSKGLQAASTLPDGDVLISGYLTRWDEVDREQEAFVRGSFAKAIPDFLKGSSPLCVHHSLKAVIGKVLSLEEDHIGVKMVARVFAQAATSPLRWAYDALRNGAMKGLSVGAVLQRIGDRIVNVPDIVECSITSGPVLASAGFEVVATGGKAMEFFTAGRNASAALDADLAALRAGSAQLRAQLAVHRLSRALST